MEHDMRVSKDPYRYGVQHIERYDNGYGASYVSWTGKILSSYGGEKNLWELAVVTFKSNDIWDFKITYDTPIANDVIGNLTIRKVEKILKEIEALPKLQIKED